MVQFLQPLITGERLDGRREGDVFIAWGANLLRRFAACSLRAAGDVREKQWVVVAARSALKLTVDGCDDSRTACSVSQPKAGGLPIEFGLLGPSKEEV